jgi:CheY-like chemotaxis protein
MSQIEAVGRPMEILLVEDSLVSARVAMGALKNGQFKHRMTWLMDGQEALDFLFKRGLYARAPRPDLILLDLGLPTRDGREVLAEIKGSDELVNIPVVVLTSEAYEDFQGSEPIDVEGYMTKPVQLDKFLTLVKDLKNFWHAGVILPTS